eukprot:CAMPEP_0198559792 /NCGR_PEP_ID=MMETSP1462-20131121/92951_1 /TAXON_ID=1333877 /ORGANISM="Brandtodinium nutriculum, Strain RCC3387" /LENGTH=30 /DNA_ID= /DNA_START= /DNA_END= /DNA_ORIENTATION=
MGPQVAAKLATKRNTMGTQILAASPSSVPA